MLSTDWQSEQRKWFFNEINKENGRFLIYRLNPTDITMSNVHMFWPTRRICIRGGMLERGREYSTP